MLRSVSGYRTRGYYNSLTWNVPTVKGLCVTTPRIYVDVVNRLIWLFVYLTSKTCILILLNWQILICSSWQWMISVGHAFKRIENQQRTLKLKVPIWVCAFWTSRELIRHAFKMIDKWNLMHFEIQYTLDPKSPSNSHCLQFVVLFGNDIA